MPVDEHDSAARIAIRKGVAYLLAGQKNGNWERQPTRNNITHTGGETALVAFTLLHLGECLDDAALRPDSEPIAAALKYLVHLEPTTTYVASMQALALSRMPPAENQDARKAAERARSYLMAAMRSDGGFSYTAAGKDKATPDNANASAAIQALGALQQVGVEAPPSFWVVADDYWRSKQHKDGGWAYDDVSRNSATPGMTGTAVASLGLAAAFRESKVIGGEVPRDNALANGLTFLGSEFKPDSRDYYFLYQLQRAARAAGVRYLGKRDVIAETASAIAAAQRGDGSWQGEFADPVLTGDQSLVSTCYALLTLGVGFQPTAISKLDYGSGESRWDARPRDAANLTLWLSGKLSRPMRWQVISANTPAADDFAAPLVLITGSKDLTLPEAMQARLRAFIEAGGTVVSVADAPDATAFTDAITRTLAPNITGGKHAFRELPASHPLFDLWGKISPPPKVLGMSNGVRELWVHVPVDASSSWQFRKSGQKDHFTLAINLYSYVTGKGEPWTVEPPAAATASAPATQAAREVRVARISLGGSADPEPAAWPRFARRAPEMFRTKVTLEDATPAKLDATRTPVAHLTATGVVAPTEQEIGALKAYVDGGGLLVLEAAGGDEQAAASVAALSKSIVPGESLATIPRNDLLFNGAMPDSAKLAEVSYRRFTTMTRRMELAPRLQGISRGGRWVVVVSEDDLTCGLLGLHTWGISGYAPRDAERIVRNLLLYALKPTITPTTNATDTQPAEQR